MDIAIIQKRLKTLEEHEVNIKNAREMLKGELDNSPEYQNAVEEAKEANDKKKRIKDEILSKGPNQKLLLEVKENTEEILTLKEILSAELIQIHDEEKSDSITDANGEVRKFKVVAKILPKNGSYQSRDSWGKYENIDK